MCSSFAAGLTLAFLLVFHALNGAESCTEKFREDEFQMNVTEYCLVKLNLTMIELDERIWEENNSKIFDDKCLAHCIWIGLDLMNSDGFIDKDTVTAYFEVLAPDETIPQLSGLIQRCANTHNQFLWGVKRHLFRRQKPNYLCEVSLRLNVCLNKGWKKICRD